MSDKFEKVYAQCIDTVSETVFNSPLSKYEQEQLFDLLSDNLTELRLTYIDAERKWALKFDSMCEATRLLGER